MKRNLKNKDIGIKIEDSRFIGVNRMLWSSIFILLLLVACNTNETAHEHDRYTCPMHPTVLSDQPGKCPVCGMDLVRKAAPGEEVKMTKDLSRLLKSPNEVVVASVKTIRGQYKSVPVAVEADGVVTYDTRNIYTIPARVGGRLEKVALKYTFQKVSKGQKVAEIYSPELITAQRELLFLLENDPLNTSLISAATRKLELLGMSASQINRLTSQREASNMIGVYSPYSGYLITGQTTPPTSTTTPVNSTADMGDGMGGGGPTPTSQEGALQTPASSLVREGDYVTAGQALFTIVNNRALRIELNLPGAYSGTVREGTKVQLRFGDEHNEAATVDFVQPFFEQGQEFLKIRVYTHETEGLHIGHLANATVYLEEREALWVPRESVLELGVRKVVFQKDGGVFKPKEVTTGVSVDGMTEITTGLASSDEIAENAQFLVDSESFIQPDN